MLEGRFVYTRERSDEGGVRQVVKKMQERAKEGSDRESYKLPCAYWFFHYFTSVSFTWDNYIPLGERLCADGIDFEGYLW